MPVFLKKITTMKSDNEIIEQVYYLLERGKLYMVPNSVTSLILKTKKYSLPVVNIVLEEHFGLELAKIIKLFRQQFRRKMVSDIRKFFIILGYQNR